MEYINQQLREGGYTPEQLERLREILQKFREAGETYIDALTDIRYIVEEMGFSEVEDDTGDDERARGEPRKKHKTTQQGKDIPKSGSLGRTGIPNSSEDLLKPDGTLKQRRYYGPNGKAQEDIDYEHQDDGTHTFPHRHKWDWSKDPPNQRQGPSPMTAIASLEVSNMFPVHDNDIYSYTVDLRNQTIILRTQYYDSANTVDIVFSGVLAHYFENELKHNIILDVCKYDIASFLEDNEFMLSEHKNQGWPIDYDTLEELQQMLEEEQYHYFAITSSYGMGGWVLAKHGDTIVN